MAQYDGFNEGRHLEKIPEILKKDYTPLTFPESVDVLTSMKKFRGERYIDSTTYAVISGDGNSIRICSGFDLLSKINKSCRQNAKDLIVNEDALESLDGIVLSRQEIRDANEWINGNRVIRNKLLSAIASNQESLSNFVDYLSEPTKGNSEAQRHIRFSVPGSYSGRPEIKSVGLRLFGSGDYELDFGSVVLGGGTLIARKNKKE